MTDILLVLLKVNIAGGGGDRRSCWRRGSKVHELMGPDAAYLMWAIVPVAMLATLIPSRRS